jgi:hypothetical protein
MIDVNTLDRLRARVWDDGYPDSDARRAATEIDRLKTRLWFWRTLALVVVVALIGVTAANAQGAPPITPYPGNAPYPTWSPQGPTRCVVIGDRQQCVGYNDYANGNVAPVVSCRWVGWQYVCERR